MREHVVLVHQRQLVTRSLVAALERVADDALDAERGVQALLGRHLVRRAPAQDAAGAGVRTLGPFAHHDHVDVGRGLAGQRRLDTGVEPNRPQVDVVVELEPQPQQQTTLEDAARHGGVAHRAEQDRVVPADLLEHRVGQRLAGGVPASRAEVVLGRRESRPRCAATASRTLRPSATTSGPMPSPPMTASRYSVMGPQRIGASVRANDPPGD